MGGRMEGRRGGRMEGRIDKCVAGDKIEGWLNIPA